MQLEWLYSNILMDVTLYQHTVLIMKTQFPSIVTWTRAVKKSSTCRILNCSMMEFSLDAQADRMADQTSVSPTMRRS